MSGASNVDLVVAWRRSAGFEFMRIKTAGKADEKLAEIVDQAEVRLSRGKPRAYSIGDDIEPDEAMSIQYDALPQAPKDKRPQLKWASPKKPADFRLRMVTLDGIPGGESDLRHAAEEGRPIAFYAIVRGSGPADRVAYLRHKNPMAQIKPGAFFLALGETLTKIDYDVFTMDDQIDVILRADRADIFGKSFFDTLFFELSAVDAQQNEGIVREALADLPFESGTLEALIEAMQHGRRARRRMLTIRESAHLTNITLKQFRDALRRYDIEESRFIKRGKIAAAEQDLEELLEVLNEDLYDGYLTGRRLVASKKGPKKS